VGGPPARWRRRPYDPGRAGGDGRGAPGATPDGSFGFLYQFQDEQLSELRNATVHAFLSLSIRPTPGGYSVYLGVFVHPVHRFTRLYMGAIAPFRHLVVYPALIRRMRRAWIDRYGGAGAASLRRRT
jgi:hypothetical protein